MSAPAETDGGVPLFTFALVADTHINPRDGESGSPWRTNALANDRARAAVDAINADGPAFVVHMGDMVHPVPAQPGFAAAAERYRAILGELNAPLYPIPGNHDIGDKPVDWTPAALVDAPALKAYRDTFGPLWQSFSRKGCRFVLHASPLAGTDLPEDAEQWAFLEAELADARRAGERIFFLTHYPLFIFSPDEPEHYDNLGPAVRARLLDLIERHAVEAVFGAHVHTTFRMRHGPVRLYVIPAVSAIRLDYSWLFRGPPLPGQDNGRDDAAKLGHVLVDVFADGHRVRMRRSDGAVRREGEAVDTAPRFVAVRGRPRWPERAVGVDLRQGFAEPLAVPYTGVVDEFSRKAARNDYLVVALEEAGIGTLRVPIADLAEPRARDRLAELADLGHRAAVFAVGPPGEGATTLVERARSVLSGVEVIARLPDLPETLAAWRPVAREAGVRLVASKLWTSGDLHDLGDAFSHFIGHGFAPGDTAELARLSEAGLLDAAIFRVGPSDAPFEAIRALPVAAAGAATAYVAMGGADPAIAMDDDARQLRRVIEARLAVQGDPRMSVIFDSLEDFDRGYYPRNGLYDIRFNPRPAGLALAALASLLPLTPGDRPQVIQSGADGRPVHLAGDGWSVVLPATPTAASTLGVPEGAKLVDLVSGAVRTVRPETMIAAPAFVDHRPGVIAP